jgi:hypothetical protein
LEEVNIRSWAGCLESNLLCDVLLLGCQGGQKPLSLVRVLEGLALLHLVGYFMVQLRQLTAANQADF